MRISYVVMLVFLLTGNCAWMAVNEHSCKRQEIKEEKNAENNISWDLACKHPVENLKKYIQAGGDVCRPTSPNGHTVLLTIIGYPLKTKDKEELVRLVLDNKADVNSQLVWPGEWPSFSPRYGPTLLHSAVLLSSCNPGVVKILLEAKANVNACMDERVTPLDELLQHCRYYDNFDDVYKMLKAQGAIVHREIMQRDVAEIDALHSQKQSARIRLAGCQ